MSTRGIPYTRIWRLAIACAIACLLPALVALASGAASDESPLTPYLAVDINPTGGSWPTYMALLDGAFLCRASHSDTGTEPSRSDGTPEGKG